VSSVALSFLHSAIDVAERIVEPEMTKDEGRKTDEIGVRLGVCTSAEYLTGVRPAVSQFAEHLTGVRLGVCTPAESSIPFTCFGDSSECHLIYE
jgi:hypothetical protein